MTSQRGPIGGHGPGSIWGCTNDDCGEDPILSLAKGLEEKVPLMKQQIKKEQKEKVEREITALFS